jgi:CRP-like cAMP-binding protein
MKEEKNHTVHSSFWSNIFNPATEKTDLQKSLQSIPLFEGLGKRDLSLLLSIVHSRSYLTGEYIFYQGDPGIGLYIIREGDVKVIRGGENSNEIILATFTKGDFFGELALVDGERRSASAVAKTDVKAAVIFKPDLDEFIDKYPRKGIKILNGIAHIIATRLRSVNEDFFSYQNMINKRRKHDT